MWIKLVSQELNLHTNTFSTISRDSIPILRDISPEQMTEISQISIDIFWDIQIGRDLPPYDLIIFSIWKIYT